MQFAEFLQMNNYYLVDFHNKFSIQDRQLNGSTVSNMIAT